MDVSTIPIRSNGQRILASWFNTIRSLLQTIETFYDQWEAAIDNNISVPTDITDMTIISANHTSVVYEVEVYRFTDSSHSFANGRLVAQQVNGTWRIDSGGFIGDPDSAPGGGGIDFSIVETAGVAQVQYITNDLTGANYNGNIKFRRLTFNV